MYLEGARQRRQNITLSMIKLIFMVAHGRDPGFKVQLELDLMVYLVQMTILGHSRNPYFMRMRC
jgi:hypothetical protein